MWPHDTTLTLIMENNMIIELCNETPSYPTDYIKTNKFKTIISPIFNKSKINKLEKVKWLTPPRSADTIFHAGYYHYLSIAWSNHYSIVLKPDDIWNIVLNELATEVVNNSKTYATLFTTTPDEKQQIIVLTGDVESIDPLAVVAALKNRVPSDVNAFFPTFTTTTDSNRLANSIVFCDMVSPYYEYCTKLCGIPKIKLLGTSEDWLLLAEQIDNLKTIFQTDKVNTYLTNCHKTATALYDAISGNNTVEFFKNIFKIRSCGSGSDEVNGWMISFLMNNPKRMDEGKLPGHVSSMHYKNLDTNREFDLYSGIFYSTLDGEFIIPDYHTARVETTNAV